MPQRAKIRTLLPDGVRKELDARLIDSGFGGYTELAGWLEAQGFEIGRSSIHRYGAQLEQRIARIQAATESAEALVEASGDERGALADASMRMIQERMYDVLMASEETDVRKLSAAAKALAETARAGVVVREERRKTIAAVRDGVEEVMRKAPASPETLQAVLDYLESAGQ